MGADSPTPNPRTQILKAALDLFHQNGVVRWRDGGLLINRSPYIGQYLIPPSPFSLRRLSESG